LNLGLGVNDVDEVVKKVIEVFKGETFETNSFDKLLGPLLLNLA
jgi:hypothetical protein